jgi:hypothetical protein
VNEDFEFYIEEPVIVGNIGGIVVGASTEKDKADKFCVEYEADDGLPERGWFFSSQMKRTPKH